MKPDDFIATIGPAAQDSMRITGIPASFTVAEAAVESGWGTSGLTIQAKNLFGVKADKSWTGPIVVMQTREFLNGEWVMVPARWRKYDDWHGSIEDHAEFLVENPRYHAAFEQPAPGEGENAAPTGERFAQAVAAAGYATDPDYAAKIIQIMRAHDLHTLDLA